MGIFAISNLGGGVALPKALYLYKNGTSKVDFLNNASGYLHWTNGGGWTFGASSVYCDSPSSSTCKGFVTDNAIDLTNYAKICVKRANGDINILDISAVSGAYYIGIIRLNAGSTQYFQVHANKNKNSWNQGTAPTDYDYTDDTIGTSRIELTEIYLEPYPTRLSDGELYSYGVDGKLWDNTGYAYDSRFTVDGGFTFNKRNISCNMPTSDFHDRCIVTKDTVNLSSYSYVKIKYNDTQIASINVSSITTSAYIVLETHCANGSYQFVAYIAQSKNNYTSNFLGSANIVSKSSAHTPTVSRIWLE